MTEVEVQQRAKRYLDCLVQGINPLDGTVIPEGDTVRQVRIARCLQYVSGILEQVIENHGEVQRVKKKRSERLPFSLTPEQLLSLKPEPQPVSISEIVQKCNAMIVQAENHHPHQMAGACRFSGRDLRRREPSPENPHCKRHCPGHCGENRTEL